MLRRERMRASSGVGMIGSFLCRMDLQGNANDGEKSNEYFARPRPARRNARLALPFPILI